MISLKKALSLTRAGVSRIIDEALCLGRLEEGFFEDLEEALLSADLGPGPSEALVLEMRAWARAAGQGIRPETVKDALAGRIAARFPPRSRRENTARPHLLLVLGVNGTGKTTTLAKLARAARDSGSSVLLVGCDTYRAAAADQIRHWADRLGLDSVIGAAGADPASVLFDALSAAEARGHDWVGIDTAGRLHVERNLMEELSKIIRVAGKKVEGAPHEVLLCLDATTGQNGLRQAEVFNETAPLTGIVLTKLDSSSKGGIALTVSERLGLPILHVGLGETEEDLAPFDPVVYARSLAGLE